MHYLKLDLQSNDKYSLERRDLIDWQLASQLYVLFFSSSYLFRRLLFEGKHTQPPTHEMQFIFVFEIRRSLG